MRSIQDQVYEFDVNGYCVIRNALDDSVIAKLNDFWERNLLEHFCCIPGSHRANFKVPAHYRDPPEHGALNYLPNTPNYSISGPHAIDENSLTARQRQLVLTPAYARGREPIRS